MKRYGVYCSDTNTLCFSSATFSGHTDTDGFFGTDNINIAYKCKSAFEARFVGVIKGVEYTVVEKRK